MRLKAAVPLLIAAGHATASLNSTAWALNSGFYRMGESDYITSRIVMNICIPINSCILN
jgi:hypothetical protein